MLTLRGQINATQYCWIEKNGNRDTCGKTKVKIDQQVG